MWRLVAFIITKPRTVHACFPPVVCRSTVPRAVIDAQDLDGLFLHAVNSNIGQGRKQNLSGHLPRCQVGLGAATVSAPGLSRKVCLESAAGNGDDAP